MPDANRPPQAFLPHTAEWLKACFAQPRDYCPVVEDGARPDAQLTSAAVLIPVVRRDEGLHVLLTRRTDHLRDHPGQVSFPGGRAEPEDDSPVHTALREAEEEIGLSAQRIDVLGCLEPYHTGTGFRVTPVVGLVTPPFDLNLDAFEVAEVFETPFSFLMDPENHQRHSAEIRGRLRHYYAMPWQGYFIWGATAGMIVSLYRFLHQPRD